MTLYKPVLLPCFLLFSGTMSMIVNNEWSNCSRTCGMGISHRLIPCQDNSCTGVNKEFQLCNLKECPDGYVDFRSEQCQKYGDELIPFNDTSNPCKLICMLPGEEPVEKATAVDGTPCLSGGICVDGTCVPVGCNGILGSEEKIDKCGRCGSANGICLQVPCVTNHNISTNEFIITVPAGSARINITWTSPCNISVFPASINSMTNAKEFTIDGPLSKKITVKSKCQKADHILTCGYHAPLYEITKYYTGSDTDEKNYQWRVESGFTACSRTCGIGVQISKISCQNTATEKNVEASFCDNLSTQHLDTRIKKCIMPPCPHEWKVTDWSPCSKSCGRGHRIRNVTCVQTIDALSEAAMKDPTHCLNKMPKQQEPCNYHHCYNHWHKGPWSACSSACGNGTRTRNVTCINAHGIEIEANNCSSTKPKETRKCTGEMCIHKWTTSDWSNCSVHCGQGNQTRNVHCQYVNESKAVNDSLCLQSIKPPTTQQCQGSYCTGKWQTEKWGECQAPGCNIRGSKYRNHYCVIIEDSDIYIDNSKCDNSTKPAVQHTCYITKGCKPEWVALPWTECDKSCHKGSRTRGLLCKLGDKVVDSTKCPEDRPTQIQECNVNVQCPCTPSSGCPDIEKHYCNNLDVQELCTQYCCNCTQDVCTTL